MSGQLLRSYNGNVRRFSPIRRSVLAFLSRLFPTGSVRRFSAGVRFRLLRANLLVCAAVRTRGRSVLRASAMQRGVDLRQRSLFGCRLTTCISSAQSSTTTEKLLTQNAYRLALEGSGFVVIISCRLISCALSNGSGIDR